MGSRTRFRMVGPAYWSIRKILARAKLPAGVTVFHAGTSDADGTLRANGGRVLTVTAVAPTFREAQARSKAGCELIEFAGKVWRDDIGWREANRR